MNWILVVIAGLLEIGWAVGLKFTAGFTRFWPSVGTVTAMVASLLLLGIALKSLPVGTAYAVWVGIGAVGTAAVGMLVLNEPATTLKICSLALIVAGLIGLKLA